MVDRALDMIFWVSVFLVAFVWCIKGLRRWLSYIAHLEANPDATLRWVEWFKFGPLTWLAMLLMLVAYAIIFGGGWLGVGRLVEWMCSGEDEQGRKF